MSPTTCPKCGRPVESMPGVPANFCTRCGTPTTSDAIRERIVHLMALGLQDDIRRRLHAWSRPNRSIMADLRRSSPGGSGNSPRPVPAVYAASR